MTNEWKEFKAYTEKPTYSAENKHDLSYIGRFTFRTITDYEGLGRILTIIARGYLFHDKDGNKLTDNPFTRINYVRKALCAWCSIPGKNDSELFTNFGELSDEFPELVNSKGKGWYYRHIKNIIKFVKKNPDTISEKAKTTVTGVSKGFKTEWKMKVRQMQVPIFAINTKAAWALRFDDVIADALELGPLLTEEYILSPETTETLQSIDLNGVSFDVMYDVVAYYEANKQPDSTWVVLPVANFDCYYGNSNFGKKWLSKIPDSVLVRDVSNGVCRIKPKIPIEN